MKRKCLFCELWKVTEKNRVVFENDIFYVIEDIRPCAKRHYLVITKDHIRDCNALTHADKELLNEMETLGERILHQMGAENEIILGFHQRPWHSIGHIHLHCIELPFRNCLAKFSHSYPFFVKSERVHKWID